MIHEFPSYTRYLDNFCVSKMDSNASACQRDAWTLLILSSHTEEQLRGYQYIGYQMFICRNIHRCRNFKENRKSENFKNNNLCPPTSSRTQTCYRLDVLFKILYVWDETKPMFLVLTSFLCCVVIIIIPINRMVGFISYLRSFKSKCQRQEPPGHVTNYVWTVLNEIQTRVLAKCQFVNYQTKQDHCGIEEKVQYEFYLLFTQNMSGEHIHSGSTSI